MPCQLPAALPQIQAQLAPSRRDRMLERLRNQAAASLDSSPAEVCQVTPSSDGMHPRSPAKLTKRREPRQARDLEPGAPPAAILCQAATLEMGLLKTGSEAVVYPVRLQRSARSHTLL